MLKKIEIKNINSISFCELDLTKGNYKFGDENIFGDVVNPIAIYGHNGSGKSSFINAISQFIVLMSQPIEALMPFVVNNFAFEKFKNSEDKNEDLLKGSIRLFFEIKNDSFEYFIETSRKNLITSEFLKKNDDFIFERHNGEYKYLNEQKNINMNSSLVPLLRILASSEINDEIIQVIYAYISSFTSIISPSINSGGFVTSKLFHNTNSFDLISEKSQEVKEILKGYKNFPIYDVKKSNKISPNGMIAKQFSIIIEDGDFKGQLPIDMMSVGMRNQSLLLSILLSMPENSVIFIDEVDFALHPMTIKSFLNVIHKKNVQIIFTLHNTFAMQMLRPDQVYFSKWSKGSSTFCRLSKIYPNIREVNNIEKMYLSSLFDEAGDCNG